MLDFTDFFAHFHLFQASDIPHVVIVHDIINLLETSIFAEDEDEKMEVVQINSDGEDENEIDLKVNIHNFLNDSRFIDKQGKLDYGVKLANYLPILCEAQAFAKKMISDNESKTNQKEKKNKPFLDEMILIVGMECMNGEFEELYPFWRYFKFERFLRCDFDEHTNVISIKYDKDRSDDGKQSQTPSTGTVSEDSNGMKTRRKRRRPPTVYCYVGSDHIDMIQKNKSNKK